MKLIRTARIKLNLSVADVQPTILAYTKAFNHVCQVGFNSKDKNSISLHRKTYTETRLYLPSQLAISSRMKAAEALASAFTKTKYKKLGSCTVSSTCSIRYDRNSYSLFLDKKEVSLLTVNGRKRFPLAIPDYYSGLFRDWKHCSADLCIKKNKVFLHIVFEKEIPDLPKSCSAVGIDRGINNIAVVSNNRFFGGSTVKKRIKQFQKLRSNLQKKGTRSAKRHLRRVSGQERLFRADTNHVISKQIINSLDPGATIVLEDLKGIRNKRLRKPQRTMINGWSFFQLEQFLIYKGLARSIDVIHVDARYTSQGCSRCGFVCKGNRKTQSDFCCKQCGFKLNADLNASRNICNKHLAGYKPAGRAAVSEECLHSSDHVNQPIVEAEKLFTSHQPCAGGN